MSGRPNYWKQLQSERVRDYAKFIAEIEHLRKIDPSKNWDKFFCHRSATEWFLQGMLPEISKLLCEKIYEDGYLTWNEKIEFAEDAEFLMKLNEKKTISAPPGNPVSNNCHGFKVDNDGYVIVYTDGACPSNGRNGATAGIGVWFGNNHHL